ncbi:hypothetical protein AB2B41_13620 [Marimonas sp. MJW-29]|uniref:Cytochrome c domain-containing protein n=1 Tax=Sulfitobacter sediminis TaxID=3234186 RepID=A0ABV3RNW0_9RHOB
MLRQFIVPALCVALTSLAPAAQADPAAAGASTADYAPFPKGYDMPAGFDFSRGTDPTDADWVAGEARLLGFLEKRDFPALRAHAWQVFAGMTSPAPGGYAVWESWFTDDVVYSGPEGKPPATLSDRRANIHGARQFGIGLAGVPEPNPGESVAANVLFNMPVRNHIWANALFKPDTLDQINETFNRNKTPLLDRSIPQFPPNAIAIKTIWSVVAKDGLTVLPVWDGELDQPEVKVSPPYPSAVWPRCVAISPDPGFAKSTADVTCNKRPLTAAVVGLDGFYHFQITEAELEAVTNAVSPGPKDGTPAKIETGDYAILLGIHFTTREIPNWVWATAWWHDRPDQAPFGSDRPDNVTGVWRNYMLNSGYSRDVPVAVDGGPATVWNPYIEGKYPDGMRSNCMSCHVRAVYPRLDPVIEGFDLCGALPVLRGEGSLPLDSPALATRTRLEFLWSILLDTRPKNKQPCG